MDHMPEMDNWEFYSNFCADAFVGSMIRWLKEKECMPPEEFARLLEASFYHVQKALEEYEKDPAKGSRILLRLIYGSLGTGRFLVSPL